MGFCVKWFTLPFQNVLWNIFDRKLHNCAGGINVMDFLGAGAGPGCHPNCERAKNSQEDYGNLSLSLRH